MDNKKIISRMGWSLFTLVLISQISMSIMMALMLIKDQNSINNSGLLLFMNDLSIYVIGFGLMYLIIRKIPVDSTISTQKIDMKKFLILVSLSLFSAYIINLATMLPLILIGVKIDSPLDIMQSTSLLETFIYFVVIAPIAEEVMFRKVILRRLSTIDVNVAIFISALAFGLFHGNILQFTYAFALGIGFGYIAIRTGTIKYTICLHMCVNFCGGFLPTVPFLKETFLGVFVVFILILGFYYYYKYNFNINNLLKVIYNSVKTNANIIFKNSGMILFILLSLILIIISSIAIFL